MPTLEQLETELSRRTQLERLEGELTRRQSLPAPTAFHSFATNIGSDFLRPSVNLGPSGKPLLSDALEAGSIPFAEPSDLVSEPITPEPVFQEKRLSTEPPRQFKNVADEFGRALVRGSLNAGSGLLKVFADIGRESIFDVEGARNLADKARRASQSSTFAPGTDGGVKGFVANAVGEAMPFMASVVAATVTTGPVGGFGVAYAVEGTNSYFDAIERGATEDQAETEAIVVGSINAALEGLQVRRILKFANVGRGSIKGIAAAARQKALGKIGREAGKLGAEGVKTAITEGIQEALQETTSVLAPALSGDELPTFGQAGRRIGQAALGGAVAGPIIGGAGAIVFRGATETTGETPSGAPLLSEALDAGTIPVEEVATEPAEAAPTPEGLQFDLSTVEGRKQASIETTARAKDIADKLGFTVSEDELFTTVDAGRVSRGAGHGDAGISVFLADDATQEQIDRIIIHELGHTIRPRKTKGVVGRRENEKAIQAFEEEQLAKLKEIEAKPAPAAEGVTREAVQEQEGKVFDLQDRIRNKKALQDLIDDGKSVPTHRGPGARGAVTWRAGFLGREIEIFPTTEEQKEAQRAVADEELADTREEKNAATERLRKALLPAVKRELAIDESTALQQAEQELEKQQKTFFAQEEAPAQPAPAAPKKLVVPFTSRQAESRASQQQARLKRQNIPPAPKDARSETIAQAPIETTSVRNTDPQPSDSVPRQPVEIPKNKNTVIDQKATPDVSISQRKGQFPSNAIADAVYGSADATSTEINLDTDNSIFNETDLQKAINAYDGEVRWGFEQNSAAFRTRAAEIDLEARQAATIHIQVRNNPEQLTSREGKLSPELQKLAERQRNLTAKEKQYIAEIDAEFARLAKLNQEAGVLNSTLDDYITQIWQRKGKAFRSSRGKEFTKNLRFAKQRTITEGYLEGIVDLGMEPATLDSAKILQIYADSSLKARNAKFLLDIIRDMVGPDGKKLLAPQSEVTGKNHDPDYIEIDHPALRRYKFRGKTASGAVILTDMPLRVHKSGAKRLKALLQPSALRSIHGFKQALLINAYGKNSLLAFSGFHHTALGKTAIFYGVNPLPIGPRNHIAGLDLIEAGDATIELGVKQGLTLGTSSKITFAKLAGSGNITRNFANNGENFFIRKLKLTGIELRRFKQWWDRGLWDRYYVGLKAMSYKMEFMRNTQRYPKLSTTDIAKITARDINNNFGGLPWARMGISDTYVDMMRLGLLAPDWTVSNFAFFAESGKISDVVRWAKNGGIGKKPAGMEGTGEFFNTSKGASRFMGKVLISLLGVTAAVNFALWGTASPQDDEDKKKHWFKIKLPLNDPKGRPYYLDLLGHFFEPWKAVMNTERWVTGKGSFISRQIIEQWTGKNWRGNNIGDTNDLVQGKLYRSKFEPWPEGGAFGLKRLPSRTIHGVSQFIPIPIRQFIDVGLEQKELIETISSTGLKISKGKAEELTQSQPTRTRPAFRKRTR